MFSTLGAPWFVYSCASKVTCDGVLESMIYIVGTWWLNTNYQSIFEWAGSSRTRGTQFRWACIWWNNSTSCSTLTATASPCSNNSSCSNFIGTVFNFWVSWFMCYIWTWIHFFIVYNRKGEKQKLYHFHWYKSMCIIAFKKIWVIMKRCGCFSASCCWKGHIDYTSVECENPNRVILVFPNKSSWHFHFLFIYELGFACVVWHYWNKIPTSFPKSARPNAY